MFEVIESGLMTMVQDNGRGGYISMGIPISGAFDTFSLRIGNLLVSNPPGEAGLEILLHGLKIRALRKMMVSITGAKLNPQLNGERLSMWRAVEVEKGDMISFPFSKSPPKNGCRAYLLVHGGIDVPVVLGSKSTCLPGAFGGFKGRPLKKGDVIKIGRGKVPIAQIRNREIKPSLIPKYSQNWEIRVILGPQDHLFTDEALEMFLGHAWRVSPKANRFGVRYVGSKLRFKRRPLHQVKRDPRGDPSNVPTQGIPLGGIEIVGGLEPIVIGVDGPNIGGYAMIATVISADMDKVGQSVPGDITRFKKVKIDEAYQILADSEKLIHEDNIFIRD